MPSAAQAGASDLQGARAEQKGRWGGVFSLLSWDHPLFLPWDR